MFVERFFNPRVLIRKYVTRIFHNRKNALEHCKEHGSLIRHYSFKGDEYIEYNDNDETFVWNDGSIVNIKKLPTDGKSWGRYYNYVHNYCSF